MRWYFLWIAFLTVNTLGYCQEHPLRHELERDYDRFKEIMQTETALSDSASLHQYFLIPQQLPEWFFHPSRFTHSSDYFIGVSEPAMDSLPAIQLAILRGKALALLAGHASIDNISDLFQVVREDTGYFRRGSHYLDFSRIYGEYSPAAGSYVVRRTFLTKYGEGIALVEFQPGSPGDSLSVQGEIMQLSHEDGRSLEKTLLCRLDIKHTSPPQENRVNACRPGGLNIGSRQLISRYKYEGLDNHFQVRSVFKGHTLYVPDHPYRYSGSGQGDDSADSTKITTSLNTGLWNGLIHLLFSHLNYYNRYLESRVKSSYDQYSLKQQQIVRTVSRNAIRFRLDSMNIKGHSLEMGLEVEPHHPESP